MARIPTRFTGPAALTTTAATQYTVASAEKIVVRHIHLSNNGTTSANLTMSIGVDAAGTRIFDAYPVAGTTTFDHYCYYVVDAAEIIQAKASVASQLVLTMDGDRIVLG